MAIIDPDQPATMIDVDRSFDAEREFFIPSFGVKGFADLNFRVRKLLCLIRDLGKDVDKGLADAGRAIFVFRMLRNLGYLNPIAESHSGFMKNLLHWVALP